MSVHGTQDPDTNIELAHTLGRNQGQENAVAYSVSLRGREGGATAELGGEVAGCLRASSGGGDKPHVLAYTLGRNQGQANAVLTEYNSIKDHDRRVIFAANNWDELVRENPPCVTGDITHTLKGEGFDASEDGTGRGQPIVPVAFSSKDYGGDATENMSPTLRACGHADSHANAGAPPAVAYPILEVGKRTGSSTTDPRAGLGVGSEGDPMFTLQAGAQHGVAYGIRTANTSSNGWGIQEEVTHTLDTAQGIAVAAPAIALQTDVTPKASIELAFTLKLPSSSGGGQPAAAMTPDLAVRRLAPVECERLQGFPDGHTDVPYRGKAAADGPRYKAIGNSMAVPVMRWIGQRIKLHLEAL